MRKTKIKVSQNLSEETIRNNVLPRYGLEESKIKIIKFKDTAKQRAVYKITHNRRSYCLKKVYFDKKNLLFVYSALEWLFKNNINAPKFLSTLDGNKYVEFDNMLFILTIWVDGSKCNLGETSHIVTSIRNLAYVHKCSQNFFPIKGSKNKKGLTDIYITTLKHFNHLLLSYNKSLKTNDMFSTIFKDHFDQNLEIAKFSLELASRIDNSNLHKSLCHGDYVSKNIMFDKMNNIWLIDFDNCKYDFSMHDFGYFLRRLLRRDKTSWNIELTLRLLREYNNAHPMTVDDFRYLLSFVCFPQKYWKTSRDYYRNRDKCNRGTYIEVLSKATDKMPAHLHFVRTISERIESEYGIKL